MKTVFTCSFWVILLILLGACKADEPEELTSVSLVVVNGLLIDGTGVEPIADGLVAVNGNRIAAIGGVNDYMIPEDVNVIDAADGTIIPGVINAHAHLVALAATRRHVFLFDGVTSVCDLGDPLVRMDEFENESIQSDPAARGLNAGPFIMPPGGYSAGPGYEIEGAGEAEMAVRDLYARGADYIKVALEPGPVYEKYYPVLSYQELQSIVSTAHELGLLVRAHVYTTTMLAIALEASVDVIEHVPMSYDSEDKILPMFDESGVFHIPTDLEVQLRRMIEQGVVLVPTLDANTYEPILWGDIGVDWDDLIHANFGVVRFFHDLEGRIALGNDYGVPSIQHGMPIHEMENLQAAGLSPMEVIEAATKEAAYVCGQGETLGTLEVGKLADLIVVAGNPLEDLSALDHVLYVVKDGEIVVSPPEEGQ